MAALSDIQYSAMGDQGFTGGIMDRELQWLKDNGATSDGLSDAWLEMLDAQGFGPANGYARSDGWTALLASLGYVGALSDMALQFWVDGGTFVPPEPEPGYTWPMPMTLSEWDNVGFTTFQIAGNGGILADVNLLVPPEVYAACNFPVALTLGRTYRFSVNRLAGSNSGPTWLHRIGSTVGGTEMFDQNFKQAGAYFFDVVATTEQAYVSVGLSTAVIAGQDMVFGNVSLLLQP